MDSYILIIGAMKSGTTSLFATLAQHPQIAPAHPKEPGFFAFEDVNAQGLDCLLYTSPSPRDQRGSRMPSSA